jgi:hypothetical protein
MNFIFLLLLLLVAAVSSRSQTGLSKRTIFTLVGVKNLLPGLVSLKTDGNYGKSCWNSQDLYTAVSINGLHFNDFPVDCDVSYVEIKEYQPKLFQFLRYTTGMIEAEYHNSLERLQLIPSDTVDSRSKQFFWKTVDDRLILKTLKGYEKRNFCALLPSLKDHLCGRTSVSCLPTFFSSDDTTETLIDVKSQSDSVFGLSSCLRPSCLGNMVGIYRISVYHRHGYLLSKEYILVSRNIFRCLFGFSWNSLLSSVPVLLPPFLFDKFAISCQNFREKIFSISCPTYRTIMQSIFTLGFLVNQHFNCHFRFMSKDLKRSSRLFFGSDFPLLRRSVLYDLKGSLVGRRKSSSSVVFKDQDFLDNQESFHLSDLSKKVLSDALNRDSSILNRHGIMDYSVLVRIDKPFFPCSTPFISLVCRCLSGRLSVLFCCSFSFMHYLCRGKLILPGTDGRIYHFGIVDYLQK